METVYYTVDARCLTASVPAEQRRVSGGADAALCKLALVPRRPRPAGGGRIIDLAQYRAPQAQPVPDSEPAPMPAPRRERWKVLELCSSAAVIGAALAASAAFLQM